MTLSSGKRTKRTLRRIIFWPVEAFFGYVLFSLARLLPVRFASAFMGRIFCIVAPLTPWQTRARLNLSYAMPELDRTRQTEILHKMWENLGRVIGEYPHVGHLARDNRVEFVGLEHIRNLKTGGLLIGAHIGNWEVGPLAAISVGKRVAAIYRPLNNPLLANLLTRRKRAYGGDIYRKGREAALGMVTALRKKNIMCVLVDQQLREGMNVPFFGHPARTSISHIKIAIKKQVPIFYMRTERLAGVRFRVTISPPISLPDTADDVSVLALATQINAELESWIRAAPEQWFWPHRRWGKRIGSKSA